MACTFVQADFGAPFDALDPAVFDAYVTLAKSMVLGPVECQAENEAKWRACCADPCAAIGLVVKHLISTDPNIDDVDGASVVSERVGDVSVTYANISGGDNPFSDSSYGRAFGFILRQYIRCSTTRKRFPPSMRLTTRCTLRRRN